jgi:hypothetical protein
MSESAEELRKLREFGEFGEFGEFRESQGRSEGSRFRGFKDPRIQGG